MIPATFRFGVPSPMTVMLPAIMPAPPMPITMPAVSAAAKLKTRGM